MKKSCKTRMYIVGWALIICIIVINLFTLTVNAFTKSQPQLGEVIVQTNDTLWTIAEQITPNGQDIRQTVYQIRKINRLDSAVLQPGQALLIPR